VRVIDRQQQMTTAFVGLLKPPGFKHRSNTRRERQIHGADGFFCHLK
jgi:hypothetical protein